MRLDEEAIRRFIWDELGQGLNDEQLDQLRHYIERASFELSPVPEHLSRYLKPPPTLHKLMQRIAVKFTGDLINPKGVCAYIVSDKRDAISVDPSRIIVGAKLPWLLRITDFSRPLPNADNEIIQIAIRTAINEILLLELKHLIQHWEKIIDSNTHKIRAKKTLEHLTAFAFINSLLLISSFHALGSLLLKALGKTTLPNNLLLAEMLSIAGLSIIVERLHYILSPIEIDARRFASNKSGSTPVNQPIPSFVTVTRVS